MYLVLLGILAVGAGILFVSYSLKGRSAKNDVWEEPKPEEKGKVIYLFDDGEKADDNAGKEDKADNADKAEEPDDSGKTDD